MKEKETKENQDWETKYSNEKTIELDQYLSENEIEILRRLGVEIEKNKKYTESEFDNMYMELSKFQQDETGLYGTESSEEINKKFEKILNDQTHTEREKILINMYYLECAKNIELEKTREEKLESTEVERKEYNNIMIKLDEIGRKCMT